VIQLVGVHNERMEVRGLECVAVEERINDAPVGIELAVRHLVPLHFPIGEFGQSAFRDFCESHLHLQGGDYDAAENQEAMFCLTAFVDVYIRKQFWIGRFSLSASDYGHD